MAQTGYTPIQLYQSSTTANVPTSGSLLSGELAINTADGKLFYKDSGGTVQVIASKSSGLIGGANTYVQYNNANALAGSANLTFNGTTLGVTGNITATNVYANSGTIGASLLTGTLTTVAQPNITSVGTLSSLTVSGNTSAANVTATGYLLRSVGTAITAAGTTQGTATVLTKEINIVSTVLAGNGVVLPTAVAGMVVVITNTNGNSLLVYPATGATINALAVNAALTQTTGATLQFVAPTATQWYSVGATYA